MILVSLGENFVEPLALFMEKSGGNIMRLQFMQIFKEGQMTLKEMQRIWKRASTNSNQHTLTC